MSMILVIDDEPQIRFLFREALESAGHVVLEAADGEAGMRIVKERSPALVVTDILMPGKDGLELISEIHAHAPQLPVIAISGGTHGEPLDVLKMARHLGARRTFWKPFRFDDVVGAVREELSSQTD